MNVLKPSLQTTPKTLLDKEISQREINRKTRIDRKTIRRYSRIFGSDETPETGVPKSPTPATGSGTQDTQACPNDLIRARHYRLPQRVKRKFRQNNGQGGRANGIGQEGSENYASRSHHCLPQIAIREIAIGRSRLGES
jgi:hypothetical protein